MVCNDLEEVEPERQQIVVSRSFGQEVTSLDDLQQAVRTFTQRVCEQLRARSLQAGGVWMWLNTNPFKPGAAQYHPSKAFNFIGPTSDTREVLLVAQGLAKAMWKTGYRYMKAGVGLLDLTHGDVHQGDLFAGIAAPPPVAGAHEGHGPGQRKVRPRHDGHGLIGLAFEGAGTGQAGVGDEPEKLVASLHNPVGPTDKGALS